MKAVFSRFIQTFGSVLALVGGTTFPIAALASGTADPAQEDIRKVLLSEIEEYVTSSADPANFRTTLPGDVRVAYLGFSPEEIEQNASALPDIAEHVVAHLPYGRKDYYSIPVDITDYQAPNTITVLNVDLTKDVKPGSDVAKKGADLTEVLAPDGDFVHGLGTAIFELMGVYKRDAVVEFGPPMERFRDVARPFRNALLDATCTSVVEYWEDGDGAGKSLIMILYSSADPGSDEQVRCLKMQALVFMRPESVPFSTALD